MEKQTQEMWYVSVRDMRERGLMDESLLPAPGQDEDFRGFLVPIGLKRGEYKLVPDPEKGEGAVRREPVQ